MLSALLSIILEKLKENKNFETSLVVFYVTELECLYVLDKRF